MLISAIVTLASGTAIVGALSMLLHELGKEMRSCPISGAASRGATLSVMGAYASMGLGVVALIAAFADRLTIGALPTALVSIGGAALALGIGFSVAAAALRDALLTVRREARADAQMPAPAQEGQTA